MMRRLCATFAVPLSPRRRPASIRRSGTPRQQGTQGGFTLLEVIVATLIMSIAVVGLLSAISSSLGNASRLSDYDQVSLLARRQMEQLLSMRLQVGQPYSGVFPPSQSGDLRAGWVAVVEPFEANNAGFSNAVLNRIVLEVWWEREGQRRTIVVETLRAVVPTNPDEMGRYPRG